MRRDGCGVALTIRCFARFVTLTKCIHDDGDDQQGKNTTAILIVIYYLLA